MPFPGILSAPGTQPSGSALACTVLGRAHQLCSTIFPRARRDGGCGDLQPSSPLVHAQPSASLPRRGTAHELPVVFLQAKAV